MILPLPYSQGALLVTAQTKLWSRPELILGVEAEKTKVFSRFHIGDEGRSRKWVADCTNAEHAAFITQACNTHHELVSYAKTLFRLIDIGVLGKDPELQAMIKATLRKAGEQP